MISDMMHKMIALYENWLYFHENCQPTAEKSIVPPEFEMLACVAVLNIVIAEEMRWNLNLALAYDS